MSTNVEKTKKSLFAGKKEKASKKKPKPEKKVTKVPKEKAVKTKTPKKTSGRSGKSSKLLSIRNKIVVCFLVPIVFMIIIGISAYQKSDRKSTRLNSSH